MKKISTFIMIALLAGCNSSSNNTDDKTLPPSTHLPEIEVPEKPQPQLPPAHLPDGDMSPDRPMPDTWYPEASARYGMSIASLHQACSFEGNHPQISVTTACYWQNETLTITYNAVKETADDDPGHSSTDFKHQFKWVIDQNHIDAGRIWPQSSHLATGLAGSDTYVKYGDTWYSLGFCQTESCQEDEFDFIVHPLNIIVNDNHIGSDGTPLDGGNTEFSMDSYKNTERLFFVVNFTHSNSGKEEDSFLMMEPSYPAIIYDVLSPAFGY
ncbi:hypothetical protein L4D09_11225 [Photobacterium makurazakiensis]|uniref:hypothetical protein n=1 Tax=Photobacterium makurazakiensis TaxID=2910234 RepID=UPI003D135E7C